MKKMMLLFACSLGMTAYTQAQVKFAPVVGVNLSNSAVKLLDDKADTKMKPGFHVGALVSLPLTNNLALLPGVMFSTKGYKTEDEVLGVKTTSNIGLNYVEVPVNVAFMTGTEETGRFMVHAGPYVGYALSGKSKTKVGSVEKEEDIEIGNDEKKDMLKPLEIGANVGVGYQLPMGLFGRVDYHHGFNNILSGGDDKNSFANRNFMLTFGYFIGGR
jgi:hypothetical protein